jgi:hypothetical protein
MKWVLHKLHQRLSRWFSLDQSAEDFLEWLIQYLDVVEGPEQCLEQLEGPDSNLALTKF